MKLSVNEADRLDDDLPYSGSRGVKPEKDKFRIGLFHHQPVIDINFCFFKRKSSSTFEPTRKEIREEFSPEGEMMEMDKMLGIMTRVPA